jgi:UDP-2-acetamido-3-amino-2,3-dideoxy-glucuronate N-acetyltransferase
MDQMYVHPGAEVSPDGVFLQPSIILTNYETPYAINPDGMSEADADWDVSLTVIKWRASIGADTAILPRVTVGEFSPVGAGAVITRDVPSHGLVLGNPSRPRGTVSTCGQQPSLPIQ